MKPITTTASVQKADASLDVTLNPVALPSGVVTDVPVPELDQPIAHDHGAVAGRGGAVDDDLRVEFGDAPWPALVHPLGRQVDRTGQVRVRERHRRERVDEHELAAALDPLPELLAGDFVHRCAS
jgi:hypothetical protein